MDSQGAFPCANYFAANLQRQTQPMPRRRKLIAINKPKSNFDEPARPKSGFSDPDWPSNRSTDLHNASPRMLASAHDSIDGRLWRELPA